MDKVFIGFTVNFTYVARCITTNSQRLISNQSARCDAFFSTGLRRLNQKWWRNRIIAEWQQKVASPWTATVGDSSLWETGKVFCRRFTGFWVFATKQPAGREFGVATFKSMTHFFLCKLFFLYVNMLWQPTPRLWCTPPDYTFGMKRCINNGYERSGWFLDRDFPGCNRWKLQKQRSPGLRPLQQLIETKCVAQTFGSTFWTCFKFKLNI